MIADSTMELYQSKLMVLHAAYARRMEAAGVPVHLRRQAGQIHGFLNATGVSRSARAAMSEAARWVAEAMAAAARACAKQQATHSHGRDGR
jgi:acetyl esterase/lipase